jgi:hypothetical protein
MVYTPHAPYEVLRTKHLDFPTLQRLRRFSRFWDLLSNSGNFRDSLPMLWSPRAGVVDGAADVDARQSSPFWSFLRFCDWLFDRHGRNHAIALPALMESLFTYLTHEQRRSAETVAHAIWADYCRMGRSDRPTFLKAFIPEPERALRAKSLADKAARRQSRHLA